MDETTNLIHFGVNIRIPDDVLHKWKKIKWWRLKRKYRIWKEKRRIKRWKKNDLFGYIEWKEQMKKQTNHLLKEIDHFLAYGDDNGKKT